MVDWFTCIGELDKPIVIYPIAIRAFKGIEEAAFVFQFRFWMGICDDPDGWVYKSADELEQFFFLSYKQQTRVREALVDLKVLEERYERASHLMYFRIDRDVFNSLMEAAREKKHLPNGHMPKRGNSTIPNGQVAPAQTGSSFHSESTAESTTEGTRPSPPGSSSKNSKSKSKPPFSYGTFQSRYYRLTGTTPSKAPFLVTPYLELCTEHGEDAVLDCLSEWVKGQGGEKVLKGNRYGPGNFLEQVGIMLTTDRFDVSEDKEKHYPQGTVKKSKWNEYDQKFGKKNEDKIDGKS
jgi:hypothetical protein